MDQIQLLFELPWINCVLCGKDAIRWYPGLWLRVEVYSFDDSTRKFVGHILSPGSVASTNIKNVLNAARDWSTEEIVLLL